MNISVKALTKRFEARNNSKQTVVAVNNFNIEIPDGKLVALLGPSGCGKTTFLNLISGLEKPSAGKIFFGNTLVNDLPPEERGIGMVFQNYALYPHLTVRENIMFPLENMEGEYKLSKEEISEKVIEAAKLVQIENLLDRKPKEISGGQQQRVAIARALVKRPSVLLLDEPLSNLDAKLRVQTREEIRRIQKETKITTIFVTHDQEEAMAICDYMVVMNDGSIMQAGKPQDIYNKPANLFVAKFLGSPEINILNGQVKNHQLFIGEDHVLDTTNDVADQDVYVGIRPEAFIYNPKGLFKCKLQGAETRGREKCIICKNSASSKPLLAIVSCAEDVDSFKEVVRFDLDEKKTYIFSKKTDKAL